MVCCAAVLLVVGFFRRLWPGARRRAARQADFAPTAHRPAPGSAPVLPIVAHTATRPLPRPAGRPRLIVRSAAAGASGYLLATTALVLTDGAHTTASGTTWAFRTAVIVVSMAFVLARTEPGLAHARERTGCALAGWGIAWIELSEIDVHLLDLFDLTTASGHVVFHGAGVVALITGAVILARTPTAPSKEDDDVRDDRGHPDGDRVDRGGPGDPAVPARPRLAAAGRV